MIAKEKNKTGALVRRNALAIAEIPSLDKVRDAIKTTVPLNCDPNILLKDLQTDVFPRLKKQRDSAGRKGMISVRPEDNKKLRSAAYAFGTDTHLPLADSVVERYQPLVIGLVPIR